MTNEYSVWLVPEKGSRENEELDDTISRLSEEFDSPDFTPHVTVVGGIEEEKSEVLTAVAELSEKFETLELAFQGLHFSTTFHQCNYLLVEPTAELLEMRERLRKELELPVDMYVPHLSLIYGDIELGEREELHRKLKKEDFPDGLTTSRLVVYETSGGEEDWRLVEEFSLER